MAHVETHGASEVHTLRRSSLLYGLNDKPPIKEALFVAMQHVCAIFIPVVTPGLLITGALGLDPARASYILGMSLFVSGLGTFRFLRMSSVIIGLFVGFIISIFLGIADFSKLSTLPLINLPIPFRFGLGFDLVTFISFAVIYIALTLEVLGDITATSMVSVEPIEGTTYIRRLKGGILGDGVNSLIASICGSFPIVTPAQNNGIIQLTGVGSRYVGYYIAGILAFLGLFPLVGGVLLAIPTPVFGGAVMLMFGTVAVAGFNILREVQMDNRSFVISDGNW